MKLNIILLSGFGVACAQDKVIQNYFERVDTCVQAIHRLRTTSWNKICFNKDKNQNYMCNNSPTAPEVNSSHPSFDPEQAKQYIMWAAPENDDYRSKYETYCGVSECYNIMQMQNALKECFYNSESRVPENKKATIDRCQDSKLSHVFDSTKPNLAKNAGRLENDETMHKDQVDLTLWGHYETQKIVSKQKRINAEYCYWLLQNEFLYRYLKLQDLYLQFDKLVNVDIYMVSYYRDDKDSNIFYPDQISEGQIVELEMYNKTAIYMVPKDPNKDHTLEFSFYIFEAEQFTYGMKYNLITQLISGVGGLILILSVIMYLDGFKEMWKHIKEQREEMRRQKEEQERLQQEKTKNDNDANKKNGKKSKNDVNDTQRSDPMSEDEDPNYVGGEEAAVHEGGTSLARRRNL
jgi:Sec-independent protein translocase protein TatA